jgi:outer membrane cobalamin receptor
MPVSQPKSLPHCFARTPVATAVLLALASPALMAQEQTTLGEVVVTAQKRTENLQDVPISLEALGNKALAELHVQNFKDYVQMLPSVSMQPGIQGGSGFAAVYMRGVVTGGDGQATTSQPSVGMYLDEQPITTIQGNLDVHLYDIARVEALAGPQGTLYGASSQAGTIRIITNKPDLSGFSAGYSLEGNIVDGDDTGYVAEGFVNLPINDKMAVRLVGWNLSTAGWIDNMLGTRTMPGDTSTTADDFVMDSAAFAKKNYNTIDTTGARAALRIELNDNWTVTPTVQAQQQDQKGSWGDDTSRCAVPTYIDDVSYNDILPCPAGTTNATQERLARGSYNVTHFRKEFTNDHWYQAGLTIEGKIANFDLTYSGNYLNRDVDGSFDYSDYSYWYDSLYTTGYFAGLFLDNNDVRVNPAQSFENNDHYTKQSHELRSGSTSTTTSSSILATSSVWRTGM